MPYLILSDRHAEFDRVELFDEVVTIGRSPECAVQVRDAMLSRQHCRLEPREDGHWVLVDLDSRNGTLLMEDGTPRRISRHLLGDGDVVSIGRSRVCFRDGPFVAAAPEDLERRSRIARPADPHEALAGTVSGFVLEQDMEEDSRISGFPIPNPHRADPRSPAALNATAPRALGTKQRPTLHRSVANVPETRPAPVDHLDPSQALIEKPALDWSEPPAQRSLVQDLQYVAVLTAIFAAVALFLVSICVISIGW